MKNNTKKTVTKPTLVARQEFTESLVKLINESGLPSFVLQPVLNDVNVNLLKMVEQQYQTEKAQYEKEIAEDDAAE